MDYNSKGLGLEWEQCDTIRERLRKGKRMTTPIEGKDSTIAQCVEHVDVLTPALVRLLPAKLKLPHINSLRSEVELCYSQCQRQLSGDLVEDDAWEIRKMLRLIKRKAQQGDLSLVTSWNHMPSVEPLRTWTSTTCCCSLPLTWRRPSRRCAAS